MNSLSPDFIILRAYIAKIQEYLKNSNYSDFEKIISLLRETRSNGGKILVAGNGGSSALASHFATDLGCGLFETGNEIRIISITDNSPVLTAAANDFGYDEIFSRQVRLLGKKGDVLFLISSSGNSKNLIQATETAKSLGLKVIALLGFDGGGLLHQVEYSILVKTKKGEYGVTEDIHSMFLHAIAEVIRTNG
jgi:D-sedoheptulose 7-phosphate isomerase